MFNKKINIKYFDNGIEQVKKTKQGDWIDLRCVGAMKIDINNSISGNVLKRETIKTKLDFKHGVFFNKDANINENVEYVEYKKGDFLMLDLGIAMQLPKNYEANVVPRSSTFKNFTLLQTNSFGVIDYLYRGDNDRWFMPVLAMQDGFIIYNERVCQFRINKKMPKLLFMIKELFNTQDRGGHGSTGTK